MKQRLFIIALTIATLVLSGCTIWDWGNRPNGSLPSIKRISPIASIYRPLIGGGDDWVRQPLDRTVLIFATGRDQYGNPVGLSDDSAWSISDVSIRCELKNVDDTVYNPGDPYQRNGFYADGIKNACMWYPTHTAPNERLSNLPYSLGPEVGYPFDSCFNINGDEYPEQKATITARAKTDYVFVEIVVPKHNNGFYVLDMVGATPQSSNVFEVRLAAAGDIDIIWQDGGNTKIYTVTVPIEWFWLSGSWEITVMATGTC